jgi:hypothetical protein
MTLTQLVLGTSSVLPVAMIRYMDGRNIVESMRFNTYIGTKMKTVTCTVRASGIGNPDELSMGAYIVQIAFFGVDFTKEAPSPSHNIGVRCDCQAYRFYFGFANQARGCSFGTRVKPYVRKTPPSDPRYPPKNPLNIPGLCKHLLLVASTLQHTNFYKMIQYSNKPEELENVPRL